MILERSTISIGGPPWLPVVSPARVERILVDERPLDAVEGEPKLVEGFLYRCANRRLLGLAHGVPFHRERADLHMFFVDAHMQRPVTDIFGFALESVMPGQAIDDARHAFVGSSF